MLDHFPILPSRESWYVHGFLLGDPYWEIFKIFPNISLSENGAKKLGVRPPGPRWLQERPLEVKSWSPQEWGDSVLTGGASGASERLPLPCPLSRALVTAGAGPACALCSEEGRDLWHPWHRGLPFIILPHTCLPSLTLIPLFFSSCLHSLTASLCLPSCTSRPSGSSLTGATSSWSKWQPACGLL